MTVAIFPGSFDPVTNGHLDIIAKASKLFDHLYVVVMTNTNKKGLLTAKERVDLLKSSTSNWSNVTIIARPAALTVEVAKEVNAQVIVRGLRNTSDFVYEQQIAIMNEKLDAEVATIFLTTKAENMAIASSMVKEIAYFNGDISKFVPAEVAKVLNEKLNHEK
ncbi:pantetheine-phosphate adenylyltransferase [Lactobacillus pasteurii DSM 23907 = CRBIP 24.76]|uniref:Phosphopantetheine adenylyltransferase n=1 Tax=Lactobacillus pasteurii DSM 23907 = CRBIP 24.76 TaxID=1423790 RepID=I7LB96_9LACO|nr:pantetheine-phosphate adenylyltransferase [Lactobacillus pasteurii]KRK08664.1 pantetheine-phosphate adenylyltransferase [Lactobacillus pasteurii DSM 23907 = CRBIP 24.76]TDG76512.1 hypothetical protein C5L33_001271 [Lactobacillus pasteurii]CCI85396.1 Phosphopantetheine adenylyltransferase [Lactobacillus pasteurii DSM 23907 = CRBIP 24.76]